jgi:hypothetical protein
MPRKKRLHGVAGHSIDEMAPEEVIDDVIEGVKELTPPD